MTKPISATSDELPKDLSPAPASAVFNPLSSSTPEDRRLIEHFAPTELSASTWGPDLLHGGPINGLLARSLDRLPHSAESRLSRVTVEILGPVVVAPLEITSWVERPGRRIELLMAEMRQTAPNGSVRAVARAAGWRLRTVDTQAIAHHAVTPLVSPHSVEPSGAGSDKFKLPDIWLTGGFVAALEWRSITVLGAPGPAAVWLRLKVPLVAGEEPTALDHIMTIADVANGVGARLDPRHWTFLNTEVTVHLYEPPQGQWVGIAAETSIGSDGIAMSTGVLYSSTGPVGRVTQNVLVEARR